MTWSSLRPLESKSLKDFSNLSKAGRRPLLIRDGLAKNGNLSDWSLETLADSHGNNSISVHVKDRQFDIHEWTHNRELYLRSYPARHMSIRRMKLSRFLLQLRNESHSEDVYSIAGVPAAKIVKNGCAPLPNICKYMGCTLTTVWSAPSGRIWSLHQDECPVFMGLSFGKKLVTIAKPSASANLYVHSQNHLLSSVPDARRADLRKFPKLKRVEFLRALMYPGDLLYVPPYWWHQVEYIVGSLSFSYWRLET
ncbi:cupin-like domain-containing protein [Bradyrhizobium sp.]|uniref:cupin-like domain-containing protein n=1 Tax=Bradyrhizobium sp. TaxID=376 RepID=UPI0025BE9C2C|nr:cupin-like domain-containing protein [Bradyrhizobium sp.]